jgi:hypothetical protein
MREDRIICRIRDAFSGRMYQNLAILFCVLFGLAIIVNVELAGNPMWFWYAALFHGGAKLYADLHLALQPLFVLETDAWMQLAGHKVLAMEILSVIHLVALCLGMKLLVRESTWPDWQKGILLASTFLVFTNFTAYLYDDYHVVMDIFWIYSYVLLLMLAKVDDRARQLGLAAALGVLSGLAVTLRINDGAALLAGTGVCLLVLARKNKLIVAGLFTIVAALTGVLIVKLTGDSFSDYVSNSIIKAAGSKGGTHKFLSDPIHLFLNAFDVRHGRKWIFLWFFAMAAAGALVQRFWKTGIKYTVVLQLGMAGAAFAFSSHQHRTQLLSGELISFLSFIAIVLVYLLVPIVAARYLIWKTGAGKREWDAREVLVLPLFLWFASASTSSGGEPWGLFVIMALFVLTLQVIWPFPRQANWANLSVVTILVLMALSAVQTKLKAPYSWQTYVYSPMFANRQWYRHPVYGPMYIQRDQLRLNESICGEIVQASSPSRELLSLPLPYPNYFCDAPPWHGYVQTFFDTSTRSTIVALIHELRTAPPQWIVYQRQLKILARHERIYNHGQRLAQRDLDDLIMDKIATGQWQLMSDNSSLLVDKEDYVEGDGWLVIRTRP